MEYITRIKEQRSAYVQIVRYSTDSEFLIEQNPSRTDTINELISIMVDAICSTRPAIQMNGEDVSCDVVRSTCLKLKAVRESMFGKAPFCRRSANGNIHRRVELI